MYEYLINKNQIENIVFDNEKKDIIIQCYSKNYYNLIFFNKEEDEFIECKKRIINITNDSTINFFHINENVYSKIIN